MLKVILADDERIIRETISQLIDWSSLDLDLIGTCKNGIEAYDMILDGSPDIVLTDIKMPGLSGLDLIERASEADLDVQFIVLSGFGEFAYAQSAMKYGVKHYLLKPCSKEQIVESLKAVAGDCYARRARRQPEKSQARLQDTFLQSILLSIINEACGLPDAADYRDLYEPFARYVDFYNTEYALGCVSGLAEEDLAARYAEILQDHRQHAPTLPLYGIYFSGTLLCFSEAYDVRQNAADSGDWSLPSAASKPSSYPEKSRVFASLAALLDEILPIITRHGAIRLLDGPHLAVTYNFHGVYRQVKDRCREIIALTRAQTPDSAERLREAVGKLRRELSGVQERDFLLQLCDSVLLDLAGNTALCTPVQATECIMQLQQCADTEAVLQGIGAKLDDMLLGFKAGGGENDGIVARIQQYVQENLANPDLTLKWIAQQYLFMNVDYVSRRFVLETGQRFSAYLTEQRIRRAKTLLAETEPEKIQQIADKVGCGNNPQYFSQIFKKNTGMTPSAYAKMVRGEA